MKKLLLSLTLFAGLGLAFASCNNGAYNTNPSSGYNSNPNPLNPSTPHFACGIGGYYFSTSIAHAYDTANLLAITASSEYPDTGHTVITLYISNYKGDGKHLLGPDSTSFGVFYYAGSIGLDSLGVINITSSGSRLQGNFSFTANAYNITSGSFDMPNPDPK